MGDSVLVIIANESYLPFAKKLFANAVLTGRWDGDLLLMTNDESLKPFTVSSREVKVKHVKKFENDFSWSVYNSIVLNKFNLFEKDMKQWQHIVYLDCDITIQGDINKLREVKAFSAVPYKSYRLNQCFLNKETSKFKELTDKFDLDVIPLNTGVMAFPSSIITETTFNDIIELYDKYKNVVYGDDEILNLFFYKKWKKIKITYNFDKENYKKFLISSKPPRILHHIHDKEWQNAVDYGYGHSTLLQDYIYEFIGAWRYIKFFYRRSKLSKINIKHFKRLVLKSIIKLLFMYGYEKRNMAQFTRMVCSMIINFRATRLGERFFLNLLENAKALGFSGTCILPFGVRMHCHASDIIQRYLMVFGVWEPNISQVFKNALGPGDVAIDIGANIGYYTLLSSRLVGPEGKVFAMEASPSTFQALSRNIKQNGISNVEALHVAIDDGTRESIRIYFGDPDNSGIATVLAEEGRQVEAEVFCASLDSLIPEEIIPKIRLIKIDVEGFEVPVVQGMTRILAKASQRMQVLVEVAPERMKQGGYDAQKIFEIFRSQGFTAYTINNPYSDMHYIHSIPETPERLDGQLTEQMDIIFSRIPL